MYNKTPTVELETFLIKKFPSPTTFSILHIQKYLIKAGCNPMCAYRAINRLIKKEKVEFSHTVISYTKVPPTKHYKITEKCGKPEDASYNGNINQAGLLAQTIILAMGEKNVDKNRALD